MTVALVWCRQDCRSQDNPALMAACQTQQPVVVLYILDESQPWGLGGAAKWWLHHSLTRYARDLKKQNMTLILRRGKTLAVLQSVISELAPIAVFYNRHYEPFHIQTEQALQSWAAARSLTVQPYLANLLFDPAQLRNTQGKYFKVFTPFWRHCCQLNTIAPPLKAAKASKAWTGSIASDVLTDWDCLPSKPNWAKAFSDHWQPGSDGAHQSLQRFLEEDLLQYRATRDFPSQSGTSCLSAHLHYGEISAREVWHATQIYAAQTGHHTAAEGFLRQIGWREFCTHLLYHFPHFPKDNFQAQFDDFPWRENAKDLQRWQQGQTGYPLVDAGMRQLWVTGIMHNRVRMVVASFLCKDLLIHWHHGQAWFWDTLVDADLANNAANWQWVAGSGADAAPYFRIFNPVTQSEKFDPDGEYIRRWCPELERLPNRYLHQPWTAPENILQEAKVVLDETYPRPMVDHATARERALACYQKIR